MRVFLPGGAGLVGLNLISQLRQRHPEWQLLVVDKKSAAVAAGRSLFPEVSFVQEDLCQTAGMRWPDLMRDCDACVMLQAEIGNLDASQFERNNIESTRIILQQLSNSSVGHLVHVSSSVINSVSDDLYTTSKRRQEELVRRAWPEAVVLRPTLMFGWFDRKHLGWLARFLKRSPLFPIPGSGRFTRQPLYVQDFCSVIISCLEHPEIRGIYDITGLERISYLSLMRQLRSAVRARSLMVHLPIPLFGWLLQLWALISRQPAFTRSQLRALTAGDEFEVIDWPDLFAVTPTPLSQALRIAYGDDSPLARVEIPF